MKVTRETKGKRRKSEKKKGRGWPKSDPSNVGSGLMSALRPQLPNIRKKGAGSAGREEGRRPTFWGGVRIRKN